MPAILQGITLCKHMMIFFTSKKKYFLRKYLIYISNKLSNENVFDFSFIYYTTYNLSFQRY